MGRSLYRRSNISVEFMIIIVIVSANRSLNPFLRLPQSLLIFERAESSRASSVSVIDMEI